MLDTNVIVDAICFPSSFGRQAYAHALGSAEIMMSTATYQEVEVVLKRPRFERYVPANVRTASRTTTRGHLA